MTTQSGAAEENTALVLESIEALNAGDTERRLLAVVAPDIVIHYAEMPEPLHGRETWHQGFELMRHAFPDLEAHIDDLVAEDDKVAIRVSFRGTHQGEFQGIPATGRTDPLRQPRVLPRRQRRVRRRVDLLRHGVPLPPAELTRTADLAARQIRRRVHLFSTSRIGFTPAAEPRPPAKSYARAYLM